MKLETQNVDRWGHPVPLRRLSSRALAPEDEEGLGAGATGVLKGSRAMWGSPTASDDAPSCHLGASPLGIGGPPGNGVEKAFSYNFQRGL